MIVKNLTSKVLELSVEEITGNKREYKIYIEPHGITEIEGVIILHAEDLPIEINGRVTVSAPQETPSVKTPEPSEENSIEEEVEEIKKDTEETEEKVTTESQVSEKFICEECGAEFASARGLTSHKNRVHAN